MTNVPGRMPRRESVSWILLSVITMIYWVGPQSVRMLYALRLDEFGASDLLIGLIVGGSIVASLILAVPSGYILDGLNGRTTLFVTHALLAVVTVGFAWAPSLWWLSSLMLLQAVLSMWVWLVLQANITYVSSRPSAAWHLNLFSLGWGFGMAVGPAAVAWIYDGWGFQVMALCSFALVAVGVLIVPFTPNVNRLRTADVSADASETSERPGFWDSLRRSMRDPVIIPIMVCGFVNLYVFSVRLSFYPVYLERIGVSLSFVGVLLSVIGGASLAVRFVLPLAIRRYGNTSLLIWSTWVAIVGLALIPVSSHSAVQITAAVMIGIGLGANPVISVNLLAASRETAPGVAMGLRLLSNRIGQVTQPLVFGGVAGVLGLAWAFPLSAVLLGVTTAWVSWRLGRLGRGGERP